MSAPSRRPYPSVQRWAAELDEPTLLWVPSLDVDEDARPLAPRVRRLTQAALHVGDGIGSLDTATWLALLASPHLNVGVRLDAELVPLAEALDAVAAPSRVREIVQRWAPRSALAPARWAQPPRGPGGRQRPLEVLDADAMPVARRQLFATLGGAVAPPVTQHDHLVALWRSRTREEPVSSPAIDLASSGCIACGTCVKACPHAALRLVPAALEFSPERCRGCATCVQLCPVAALTSRAPLTWNAILASERPWWRLQELHTRRCERCGTSFASDPAPTPSSTLCPVCAERARNPFGSFVPDAPWVRERLRARAGPLHADAGHRVVEEGASEDLAYEDDDERARRDGRDQGE
ncbi:MAG: 4Fe-4S binding protein [Bowdeniella nasicola]|nr:4Fe-4S binding protein [Bowdeniella nasicola]